MSSSVSTREERARIAETLCVFAALVTGCVGVIGPGGSEYTAPEDGVATGDDPGAAGGSGTPGDNLDSPPGQPPPDLHSACGAGDQGASTPRLWRLTALQYQNTLDALVPGGTDGIPNPFAGAESGQRFNNYAASFAMPESAADTLVRASEAFAVRWSDRLTKQYPCASTLTADCIATIVADAGKRAFRRPLTSEEVTRFSQVIAAADKAGYGKAVALQTGLETLLNSPWFVFRSELGTGSPDASGRVKLSAHELASAIAYTTTDAPPDAALMAAADQGALDGPEAVRVQVTRLLGNLGDNGPALQFLREYFPYGKATLVFKDSKRAPYHNAERLVASTDLLMKDVLAQRRPFIETLLTTTAGFVSGDTAESFGVPKPAAATANAFVRVGLPDGERAGILTEPSFLVSFSHSEENNPVARGKFIAKSLLCTQLPDVPPPNVPPLVDLGPDATLREKLAVHRDAAPSCRVCHDLMDPLGLGLESYDDTGRFRTLEKGKPVDATGTIVGSTDQDGPFDGAVELGARLAASATVEQCFVRHAFRYWLGRDERDGDGCSLAAAYDGYKNGGDDVGNLVTALLSSDSFLFRNRL